MIDKIFSSYEDGKTGKAIALKGSSGFIEIAMNSGSAEQSLSAKTNDIILIRFN